MNKRFILLFVFVLLSILAVQMVLAVNACCEKTNEGEWCIYTDETNCDGDYPFTYATCEQTSYCQTGCCYGSEEGRCYANTPKARCETEINTSWTDSPECSISQCESGCCVIGDQAFYVTEVRCKNEASKYEDVEMQFYHDVDSESACLDKIKNMDWGCCVSDEGCSFTTKGSCSTAGSETSTNFTEKGFHKDMLCSNDLLSCGCAKQQTTGCYNEEVYWFDSCGNRENIYSSDKEKSYNGGYALKEEDSCVLTGSEDSDCGNCDYLDGTLCGEDINGVMSIGAYTCVDINCYDIYDDDVSPNSGGDKINGESWCLYDSAPGEGKDFAGSRHFRHYCINGKEFGEACTDFREQICIEGELGGEAAVYLSEGFNADGDYIEAACRSNRWEGCVSCDSLDTADARYDCCNDVYLRDCYWFYPPDLTDEDEIKETGKCVPAVPPGLKFWGNLNPEETEKETEYATDSEAKEVCDNGDKKCKVKFRIGGIEKLFGQRKDAENWKIIEAEDCAGKTADEVRQWIINGNSYCRSLGDCGAWYNINDRATFDGFTTNIFGTDAEVFYKPFVDVEPDELTEEDLNADYVLVANASASWWQKWGVLTTTLSLGAVTLIGSGLASYHYCNDLYGGELTQMRAAEKEAKEEVGKAKEGWEKSVKDVKKTAAEVGKAVAIDKITGEAVGTTDTYPCSTVFSGFSCMSGTFESLSDTNECKQGKICDGNYCCGPSANLWCCKPKPIEEKEGEKVTEEEAKEKVEEATKEYKAYETALKSYGEIQKTYAAVHQNQKECYGEGIQGALPLVGLFTGGTKQILPTFLSQAAAIPTTVQWFGRLFSPGKAGLSTAAGWLNVAGTVMLVAAAVEYFNADEIEVEYTINCEPWQAPDAGEDCELCNDKEKPCSEYRCRSFGKSCTLLNEGSANETCVAVNVKDVNSPIIEPWEEALSSGYTYTESSEEGANGFVVNEKLPAFTALTLGIKTDEPAMCKYALEAGKKFDEMSQNFGSSIYLYEHGMAVSIPSELTSEEVVSATEGLHTLYIKCKDANGNANLADYFIRFSIDPSPDLTPPEFLFTSIENGAYVQYGLDNAPFTLYINEPAHCKWDKSDVDYDMAINTMECDSSGFEQSSLYYGTYSCSTTLTNVSIEAINYFYFRCRDLSENINEQGFKFALKASAEELKIASYGPSGKIYDANVTLELKTEGGAEDGLALCGFSTSSSDIEDMILFASTNSTTHKQELTNLPEGLYNYYFACWDIAGNIAYNSTSFTIAVDREAPEIVNIYIDSFYEILHITMDEDSTCEYNNEPFAYGEGIVMTGSETKEHETSSVAYTKFYIKCVDKYKNYGDYVINLVV